MIVCLSLRLWRRGKSGLLQTSAESARESFSRSALDFGSIAMEITGSGNSIFSRRSGVFGAERIACAGVFKADASCDVAGIELIAFFSLVGMHFKQAGDALFFVFGRVEEVDPFCQRAAVDADECQTADIRVGHDFKGQGGRAADRRRAIQDFFVGVDSRCL